MHRTDREPAPQGQGMWPWLLQRVTAVLLLFFVLGHLWIEHFLHLGARITYASVAERLLHAFYVFVDLGLLVVVVYHGLNGLGTVLFDLPWSPAAQRRITAGLWVLGVVTVLFGADVLSPFLWGHPLFRL